MRLTRQTTRLPIRLLTLPLLMLVFVASLAACTGENASTPNPTQTVSGSTATATAQPTPTATPEPPEGLQRGGVLRFAVKEAPPHQDVHQSVSNTLAAWGPGLAYSRLFKYQSGPGVPLPSRIPECDLCESWQQTGPLEFEFTIRDDAHWQDLSPVGGRKVTAHDIVFSYNRQMTEGWANAGLLANIDEVEALDDSRLRIRLKSPDAEFFEKLADGHAPIIPREVIDLNKDLFDGPTVGSGPWMLEEISQFSATFEANRSYYVPGIPYLDGLAVQYIPADSTRAAGVRSGILDFAQTTYEEVRDATEQFPELESARVLEPGTGVEVALNTGRPPLGSLAVRQAILLAWDLDTMLEEVWGGQPEPTAGLNVPLPGWLPDFDAKYGGMFGDPDEARALLNGAGADLSGFIAIRVGEFGEQYIRTAQSLADALAEIGIRTEVQPVTTRFFGENVWLDGDYDIFIGAPLPVSSLTGQLFGIYHSEGPWNTTGYSTPELDRLIERQAVETDPQKRGELVSQIQDEIMEGAYRFYPATAVSHWLWWDYVRDFVPNTAGSDTSFLSKVWLEKRP